MVPLIYLDFSLRREYIAEVLCINKEELITVCGGKCYLTDQLEQANEQQEKETTTSQKFKVFFFNLHLTRLHFRSPEPGFIPNAMWWEDLTFLSSYLADIFRPPRVA